MYRLVYSKGERRYFLRKIKYIGAGEETGMAGQNCDGGIVKERI